jgi:hypothetical protein
MSLLRRSHRRGHHVAAVSQPSPCRCYVAAIAAVTMSLLCRSRHHVAATSQPSPRSPCRCCVTAVTVLLCVAAIAAVIVSLSSSSPLQVSPSPSLQRRRCATVVGVAAPPPPPLPLLLVSLSRRRCNHRCPCSSQETVAVIGADDVCTRAGRWRCVAACEDLLGLFIPSWAQQYLKNKNKIVSLIRGCGW